MKFSLFHLPTFFPEYHGSEAEFYQRMLAETELAETLGFHGVWFAEHHFHRYGGHLPSVPVMGAAAAQRTRRLRIGSGIALLPLQDTVRVAEEFAMLDCLSGGRLEFGIGRGFQKMEYDAFERDMADSRVLFEEAYDIILKAWSSQRLSYDGRFRHVRDVQILPKPVQLPPPIYVACIFTPESFEWTGRKGHHLMIVPYAVPHPETLVDNLSTFRRARAAAGFTGEPEVLAVYHFYCGETAEKAREEPREAMLRYLATAAEANREAAYSEQYRRYARLREGLSSMMDYEGKLYPERVIFGDPEQCINRIRQLESMGVTQLGLLADFGGLGRERVMASLERFARHVMPHCQIRELPQEAIAARGASAGEHVETNK
jgi:natural product biosynthesis luciferase-like monooxygenase protein